MENVVNTVKDLKKQSTWILLLPPYYFNYKINCLNEQINEHANSSE